MIAGMQKSILERLGYRVTMANNSLKALDLFKNDPGAFDLIISTPSFNKLLPVSVCS